jgi:Skp family chaperone for outer membrane proteins
MILKVVDFQILTSHLKSYVSGVNNIEEEKKKFQESIEPYRKELNSIISVAQSGLISGNEEERKNRFEVIQQELYMLESDFKRKYSELTTNLNEKSFEELEEIIKYYGSNNNIDMIMGKMEIVYNNESVEITDAILELMKSRGVYHE